MSTILTFEAMKKLLTDYEEKLRKVILHNLKKQSDDVEPHEISLASQKMEIIQKALKSLSSPNLNEEKQLKFCKEELSKGFDTLSQRRDSWPMEIAKQLCSLFTINIYRYFMDYKVTEANKILKKLGVERHMEATTPETSSYKSTLSSVLEQPPEDPELSQPYETKVEDLHEKAHDAAVTRVQAAQAAGLVPNDSYLDSLQRDVEDLDGCRNQVFHRGPGAPR